MATTDGAPRGSADSSPAALAWVVPVLAFLAGCLLSGIAVAVFMSDGDDDAPVAAPSATSAPAPDPAVTPSPEQVVRVPQSCLDAAASALQAGEEAEQVAAAVRDLDARRLQEIVDRFQQNQPALEVAAQRCRATTDERIEDGLSATPVPAPSR